MQRAERGLDPVREQPLETFFADGGPVREAATRLTSSGITPPPCAKMKRMREYRRVVPETSRLMIARAVLIGDSSHEPSMPGLL